MSFKRPTTGDERLDQLMKVMAISPALIINEVIKDGGSFTAFNNYQYIAKHEGEFYSFHDTRCSNSYGCMNLAEIKSYARAILASQGVNIPDGGVFSDKDKALSFFREIKGPAVVKPVDGIKSKDVTIGIFSDSDFLQAVDLASNHGKKPFIVEKEIVGVEYRVLVLNGHVIAVLRKDPPCVTGNGKNSISMLIDEKNQDFMSHPTLYNRLIIKDHHVDSFLRSNDLALESVPDDGKMIQICSAERYIAGGETVEASQTLR